MVRSHPCLTSATTRSSPLLRRVIDASIEGTCMILIGVSTDDVGEEPQTPEHDRLGDRRLIRAEADFLLVTCALNEDKTLG